MMIRPESENWDLFVDLLPDGVGEWKSCRCFQDGRPFTNRRRGADDEPRTHVHKEEEEEEGKKNGRVELLFLCRIIESRNSSLASFPLSLPTARRHFAELPD